MTGIKYESSEMQNVKSRNIKTVLAIMMISLCWMKTLDAQIIPTVGLIAYYPFTGNTNDESGKGNNADAARVTSTADRCGFSNSAYYFSGTYNYISLPPANFTSMDEYSYSLWCRADSLPSPTVDHWILFAVGSVTEGNEQALTIQSDGSLIGSSSNKGPNPHVTIIRTTPVQTGRWIHVVLIRDLVRLKIFIDAVPMANISNLDSLVNNQHADYGSDNQTATIGGRTDLTSREFFVGAIDEVRIYDRALSAEEVRQLYFTECTLTEMTGPTEVCQGDQNITFYVDSLENAQYKWEYSGLGATINGDGNPRITIDFSDDATSGTLSVTVTGDFIDKQTRTIDIQVQKLPSEAGIIIGESVVCLGDTGILYHIPEIDNATSYLWEYSGTGTVLTGNSTSVVMDFSGQATGGNLTVAGQNNCGEGARSPEFLITVNDCSINPVEISIPNSFSPNGDGVNDVFFIRGLPENSTLIIFDRAGNTLFESLSYTNNWDGKDRAGKALASGTYWYVLSVSGQPEEYKGFVYLKK